MAANPQLPRPQSQLSDAADQPTREWYEFWRQLLEFARENGATQTQIAELEQRVAALEQVENFTITGLLSVRVFGSPQSGTVVLQLLNDAQAPGNTYYYGTGPTGTKGWFAIADAFTPGDGIALTTGPDGVTEIAHGDTSSVTDITANFTGSTVVGQISLTFDQFGHVVSRTITGRQLDHNDLNAIQGGTSGEHYHLTSAEYTKVQALPAASQPLDDDLTAIAALATTGFPTRTAANTWALRSFANGTGYTWTNPAGVAGNPTLVLDATLQALSGQNWVLNSMPVGSGADTVTQLALGANTFPARSSAGSVAAKPITDDALLLLADADVPRLGTANTWTGAQTVNADVIVDIDTLVVDTTNNRVGIGIATPLFQCDIRGPTGGIRLMRLGGGMPFISFGADDLINGGQIRGNVASEMLRFTNNSGGTTWLQVENAQVAPGADNTRNLGSASLRWKEVFAGTGTINTSDEREKDAVVPFTSAELAASKALAVEIGTYHWLQSLAEKGFDARTHVGVTVQRVIAIMQSHGLDPFRYGFICYDEWSAAPEQWEEWPDEFDKDGNLIREAGRLLVEEARNAGDRYSFRHDQLLLFIARGQAERIDRLEALLNP